MQPTSSQDYKQLLTAVIKKQIVILGPDITLSKARNVKGLTVANDGTVTNVEGSAQEVTQALIDQFVQLSGLIVKKTMEPLLSLSQTPIAPTPVTNVAPVASVQQPVVQVMPAAQPVSPQPVAQPAPQPVQPITVAPPAPVVPEQPATPVVVSQPVTPAPQPQPANPQGTNPVEAAPAPATNPLAA